MEDDGTGRTAGFSDSARRASALFHTSQAGAGRDGYRPNSVLEPVTRSTSGYGPSDTPRILPGGRMLPTSNGSSAETYDRRTWLGAI